MRESLEVGRVLHEAEATTERHKRIPVEVPQGPAGGNAPRLVHVGDRSVPVAPRAVERNLPRAAGVPEHAELPAAHRAAPVGTVAGMLPEMLEDAHLVPLPRPPPNSCFRHSTPPRGRTLTAAYERKGHAPGTAPGAGPPPSAAERRSKKMPRRRYAPPSDIEPLFHFCRHCGGDYTPQEDGIEGSARSARGASTRAATSAARPCRRRTRAARRRTGPSAAAALRCSATPAASAEGCTSGPRPTSSWTPTAEPSVRRAGTTGMRARSARSTSPQTTSKREDADVMPCRQRAERRGEC